MKYSTISILAISLILSACSVKQEPEKEPITQTEVLEEPIKETTKEDDIITEVEEDIFSLKDTSPYTVLPHQLYLENGLSREHYERIPYLKPLETISISHAETVIGTVSFDGAEIIDDALGSSKKGLLLWFTETNTTNDTLEVGLYAPTPLTLITVFNGDQELKPLATTPGMMGVENNDYLENYHLEYQDKTQAVCTDLAKLLPGESRTCYQLYSYAGKGQYLINQATDETYENWKSYLLTIE